MIELRTPFRRLFTAIYHSPVFVRFRVVKRRVFPKRYDPDAGRSHLNILKTFPAFKPYSGGDYETRAVLTTQAINETLPGLYLVSSLINPERIEAEPMDSFPQDASEANAALALREKLIQYGSDKADQSHNYHYIYGALLERIKNPKLIVEIGLGTNNVDVVSNMGSGGRPGASLRAFRDLCPTSKIHGGDIDKRILFTDDRISTTHVDQTNPDSLETFVDSLPQPCDLFIDDGLHSTHANLNTLFFGIDATRPGGWVVIEDIGISAVPLWQLLARILPPTYCPRLFCNNSSFLFLVQKPAT